MSVKFLANCAGLIGVGVVAFIASVNRAYADEPPVVVDEFRELMVVHPRVVDPFLNRGRSHNGSAGNDAGSWSFRSLIQDAVSQTNGGGTASAQAIDSYLSSVFESWLSSQTVSGATLAPREAELVEHHVLNRFSTADSQGVRHYDLSKAPFELLAIVNRIDLQGASTTDAGELRFVFGLNTENGGLHKLTLILEYLVPVDEWDATTFAHQWHRLGQFELGSEEYLSQLEYITNHVTKWRPFGSPSQAPRLSRLRTNEIVFAEECPTCPPARWELREFRPNVAGLMVPAVVANTPRPEFNGTEALGQLLACYPALSQPFADETSVELPMVFDTCPADPNFTPPGTQLLATSSFMGPDETWTATINGQITTQSDSVAVDNLGLLTCNGCHNENKAVGDREFYHIDPEPLTDDLVLLATGVGRLSEFLTVGHERTSQPLPSELSRRQEHLTTLLEQASTHIDFTQGTQCTSDSSCIVLNLPYHATCQMGRCREQLHCRNWTRDLAEGEGGGDCGGECRGCLQTKQCVISADCLSLGSPPVQCINEICTRP